MLPPVEWDWRGDRHLRAGLLFWGWAVTDARYGRPRRQRLSEHPARRHRPPPVMVVALASALGLGLQGHPVILHPAGPA